MNNAFLEITTLDTFVSKNQKNLNNDLSEADWCQTPGGEVMTRSSIMVMFAAFTLPATVFNFESNKQKRSH